MALPRRARIFWPLFAGWVLMDFVSKRLVESNLTEHVSKNVLGDFVRFTLNYNVGAAMNISLGSASRVAFTLLAVLFIAVVLGMYRQTGANETAQPIALALIAAGALGNMLDRLRSVRGVVDFIDVGIGDSRFWIFNVADAGITCGAILLTIVLWKQPKNAEESVAPE